MGCSKSYFVKEISFKQRQDPLMRTERNPRSVSTWKILLTHRLTILGIRFVAYEYWHVNGGDKYLFIFKFKGKSHPNDYILDYLHVQEINFKSLVLLIILSLYKKIL